MRHRIRAILGVDEHKAAYQGHQTYRNQGALTERVDPVLIPQKPKQFIVQGGLENLHFQWIVLIGVYTEVLDLVQRDRLVLGGDGVWWCVVLWICAEGSDVNLARRNRAVWVDLPSLQRGVTRDGRS